MGLYLWGGGVFFCFRLGFFGVTGFVRVKGRSRVTLGLKGGVRIELG